VADLTDLAAVKRYLGISDGSTAQDAILSDLITGASAALQNFVNRDLMSAARHDWLDGTGKNVLVPRHYPVTSVASLKVNGQTIPQANASDFASVGWRLTDDLLILTGYAFTRGVRNVEISYTAGFDAVPDELALACVLMVALRYKERDWTGYSSKSLAGETVSFQVTDIPANARGQLASYKRVVWP
jgi:hypothetical protein